MEHVNHPNSAGGARPEQLFNTLGLIENMSDDIHPGLVGHFESGSIGGVGEDQRSPAMRGLRRRRGNLGFHRFDAVRFDV